MLCTAATAAALRPMFASFSAAVRNCCFARIITGSMRTRWPGWLSPSRTRRTGSRWLNGPAHDELDHLPQFAGGRCYVRSQLTFGNDPPLVENGPVLVDRAAEAEAIERVLAAARDGLSAVLVLRGESGIGKTALLDHVVENASDMQVARV